MSNLTQENLPANIEPTAISPVDKQPTMPTAPCVFGAINAVQAELARLGISKAHTTKGGATFKFRGIDDVYNALSPMLARHGLIIAPRFRDREVIERKAKNGSALFYVTVTGDFDFISAMDGSKHTVTTFGEAMDINDKATNKAMSVAYKYACFQVFAIPTEGDNDPDGYVHPPIQPMQQQPYNNQQSYNNNNQQQNTPSLPAPIQSVCKTVGNKMYDSSSRRIFSPEQFETMIENVKSGNYPKSMFANDDKYCYSDEQANALRVLQ